MNHTRPAARSPRHGGTASSHGPGGVLAPCGGGIALDRHPQGRQMWLPARNPRARRLARRAGPPLRVSSWSGTACGAAAGALTMRRPSPRHAARATGGRFSARPRPEQNRPVSRTRAAFVPASPAQTPWAASACRPMLPPAQAATGPSRRPPKRQRHTDWQGTGWSPCRARVTSSPKLPRRSSSTIKPCAGPAVGGIHVRSETCVHVLGRRKVHSSGSFCPLSRRK